MPAKAKAAKPLVGVQHQPEQAQPGKFRFTRFTVSSINFREAAAETSTPDKSGGTGKMQFGLEAGVDEEDRTSALTMHTHFNGEGSPKPYLIDVVVVAEFAMVDGTIEQLKQFTQTNAPVILFPYIRAVIDRTTADGRYGSLRLDPANLQALVEPQGWSAPRRVRS